MRILFLNQTFYPDCVATAQVLGSLAASLVERGHHVTVITGQRAYDDPQRRFSAHEVWNGIEIHRIGSTGLGKSAKWRRAVDFASFLFNCCLKLITLPRADVVVALTSPPLVSVLGALCARGRGRKSEGGGRREEVRGQRSEVGGRGEEVGGRRSEVGEKRSEVGGRRAGDGDKRSEGGSTRFYYWIMDLNPDEAVAAGWLRPRSFVTRMLEMLSRFSMRKASKVIALDRFMANRVMDKEIAPDKVVVVSPWSDDEQISVDALGAEQFRRKHGLNDKFVVMYSGNHSPCHPLDTLLQAAKAMEGGKRAEGGGRKSEIRGQRSEVRDRRAEGGRHGSEIGGQRSEVGGRRSEVGGRREEGGGRGVVGVAEAGSAEQGDDNCDVVFVFVGGGSEFSKVKQFAVEHGLSNIVCLPYQPLDQLAASLSAADLHVVVMGDPFVGIVHPCKIYNILRIGSPVLYIGPKVSHVTELLHEPGLPFYAVRHGDVEAVVEAITKQCSTRNQDVPGLRPDQRLMQLVEPFSKAALLPRLVAVLES